jgi:DNA-binding NarL/FixJ family response regulator
MLRILIADDHPIVRRCVRLTLEENGWEVCGEATTGREAVTMTAEQKPEVVILDLSMPELNGLDAAREIHKQSPNTKMFLLSMFDAKELIPELIASGVLDCVLKTDLQQLVNAVQSLLPHNGH